MSIDDKHGDETCTHALILAIELYLVDGWHAGTSVNTDGTLWPWLFSPDPESTDSDTRHGQPWPTHEMTGRLPRAILERVRPHPCCGAPAKTTGLPCKAEVRGVGQRCHQHRAPSKPVDQATT
jgi:hypothetical protein